MPVLKSLPPWPDPQESIGRQTSCSRVRKRTVWWPRGPALDTFEKLIQPQIEINLKRVDFGHAELFIKLYMIGRKPESANPIIMVCCTDSEARDAAEAAIRESGLLNGHEGFGLGAISLPLEHPTPVRRLSPKNDDCDLSARSSKSDTTNPPSELLPSLSTNGSFHPPLGNTLFPPSTPSALDGSLLLIVDTLPIPDEPGISNAGLVVFASVLEPLLGRRICTSTNSSQASTHLQYATAGVVIKVGKIYYQLTAGHLFEIESGISDSKSAPTSLDECRFDGQSDDDENDSDYNLEMTERGSKTPEDAQSSNGSASDSTSGETIGDEPHDALSAQKIHNSDVKRFEVPENPPNTDRVVPIAHLPRGRSFRCPIDYAIIALPNSSVENMGRKINTPGAYPRVTDVAEAGYEERNIIVVTHSTIIEGVLIPGKMAHRGYKAHQFESLIQIELKSEVFEGDSGSPVLDMSTGSLYGHIIMGVPGTKLAYIVQALDIFRDIETKIGKPPSIVTVEDAKKPETSTNRYQHGNHIPHPSRCYSVSTSSGDSSRSSIFSSSSSGSNSAFESLWASIIPTDSGLPCEFASYGHCEQVFGLDDVDNWIEHIITDHLQGELPKKVVCWFCDDFVFDSKYTAGRRQNFSNRMWHIRDHVLIEGCSAKDIRPDHHFNTHLREAGLISESTYLTVRRYTEAPQTNCIFPDNAISPMREGRQMRQAYEYRDPHEEERHYRRHRHRSRRSRN
ncbi:hypothetical protein F4825DRAFT_342036 [Nemania diffusa]|nr:hypothetical protein F4825DRAFT_342036 [Nemania diffusa]